MLIVTEALTGALLLTRLAEADVTLGKACLLSRQIMLVTRRSKERVDAHHCLRLQRQQSLTMSVIKYIKHLWL